jgi:hypothetical protein
VADSPRPVHDHRAREPRLLLISKITAPLLQPDIVTRGRLLARGERRKAFVHRGGPCRLGKGHSAGRVRPSTGRPWSG